MSIYRNRVLAEISNASLAVDSRDVVARAFTRAADSTCTTGLRARRVLDSTASESRRTRKSSSAARLRKLRRRHLERKLHRRRRRRSLAACREGTAPEDATE